MRPCGKTLLSSTLLLFLLTSLAGAGPTACPDHFAGGQAPDLLNPKLATQTQEICYSGYAVQHSGVTLTPLYAAEHLTRAHLQEGKGVPRVNHFHPDPHLPVGGRAELHHYARSGYDRGHVAPSGDMFDPQSQEESFSLANMVPQEPANNRGIWEGIEAAVRMLAQESGELYVVTGPIYQGAEVQRIGGAVLVPTSLFKAVYDPRRQTAGAYLIANTANAEPRQLSLTELETVSGLRLFPNVSAKIRAQGMHLPEPKSYRERKAKVSRK